MEEECVVAEAADDVIKKSTQYDVGEGMRLVRTQVAAFADDLCFVSLLSMESEEVGWVDGSEPVANATYEPVDGRV